MAQYWASKGFKPVITNEQKEAELAKLEKHSQKVSQDVQERAAQVQTAKKPVGRPKGSHAAVPLSLTKQVVKRSAIEIDQSPPEAKKPKRLIRKWFAHAAVILPIVEPLLARPRLQVRTHVKSLQRIPGVGFIYAKLNESTVRYWFGPRKKDDTRVLKKHIQGFIKACSSRARSAEAGGPLKAYPQVIDSIKQQLLHLRKLGVAVNTSSARLIIKAIIQQDAPELLGVGKGQLTLSHGWVHTFLKTQLGWVMRKGTSDAQKLPNNAAQLVEDMLMRLALKVILKDVRKEFVYHFDETFFFFQPMGGASTLEVKGAKTVPIANAEDKRGGTVVLGGKLDGTVLPFQVLYKGTTQNCTPGHATKQTKQSAERDKADKAGHHVYYSANHWCTTDTLKQYYERIIIKDYKDTCISRGCKAGEQQAVVICDLYRVHISEEFRQWLKEHHPYIHLILVPGGCTGIMQIADVIMNRPFKAAFKRSYNEWQVQNISKQLSSDPDQVIHWANSMSEIKPLTLRWLRKAWKRLTKLQSSISKVIEKLGYLKAWDDEAFRQQAVRSIDRLCPGDRSPEEEERLERLQAESDQAAVDAAGPQAEAEIDLTVERDSDDEEVPMAQLVDKLVQAPPLTIAPPLSTRTDDLDVVDAPTLKKLKAFFDATKMQPADVKQLQELVDEGGEPAIEVDSDDEAEPAIEIGSDDEAEPAVEVDTDDEADPAIEIGSDDEAEPAVEIGSDDEEQATGNQLPFTMSTTIRFTAQQMKHVKDAVADLTDEPGARPMSLLQEILKDAGCTLVTDESAAEFASFCHDNYDRPPYAGCLPMMLYLYATEALPHGFIPWL